MILSIELKMLLCATILGIVQLILATSVKTAQRGLAWNMSSREEKVSELTGMAGRLDRAYKNFMETFPFFIAAILIVQITTMADSMSSLGAQTYFWARLIYVPVYAFGIVGIRSLVWLISLIGLLMVLATLIF